MREGGEREEIKEESKEGRKEGRKKKKNGLQAMIHVFEILSLKLQYTSN